MSFLQSKIIEIPGKPYNYNGKFYYLSELKKKSTTLFNNLSREILHISQILILLRFSCFFFQSRNIRRVFLFSTIEV